MSAFGWALAASFCWGFAPLLEKFGLRGNADPVAGVLVRSLGVMIGALFFLPFLPKLMTQIKELTPRNWAFLLAGGVVASIIGQLCFYRALKIGEMSRVVPVGASYPVMAFLLSLVILHEPLTAGKSLGLALVVAGTWLLR